MPVVAQAGATLANVLYNDRTSAALQQYEFSSRDLDALTQDILNSGQDLFEAVAMVLALEKDGESALTATFLDGHVAPLPASGSTASVFSTQFPLYVENVASHPDRLALQAEFGITPAHYADCEGPLSLVLHPIKAGGATMAVLGIIGSQSGADPTEDEQRIVTYCGQAGICLSNCLLYAKATEERRKIAGKLETLEVAKSIASEVQTDKMRCVVTALPSLAVCLCVWSTPTHNVCCCSSVIIDKTRGMVNADRCCLFLADRHRDGVMLCEVDGRTIEADAEEGILGWVCQNRQCVRVDDAYSDSRFSDILDRKLVSTAMHTGYRSYRHCYDQCLV